ncbi:hypothetical protein BGZ73_003541 [Actinomortierella ambigua]|nr:hypothetical protein BGZ73_003541 [Actinomortierella ambigua]
MHVATGEISGVNGAELKQAAGVATDIRSSLERTTEQLEMDPAPGRAHSKTFLSTYHKLYLSHALTSWVDRSFEFASYLLISKVYSSSLIQASAYGLSTTLMALIFSNRIGNWINILSRLNTYRITLLVQKVSIIASTFLFYFMVENKTRLSTTVEAVVFACILLLGCSLKLAFIGNSIAIEKDWAMIISDGHLEQLLPTMRRIDLICKTVSPILVGFLAESNLVVFSLVVGGWTAISTLIEYVFISQIYRDVPRLADRAPYQSDSLPSPTTSTSGEREEHRAADESGDNNSNSASAVGFFDYLRHRAFPLTISIGMLYINVLSFGGPMTSYLVLMGYNSGLLGIMKAVSGIVGIAGTFVQPVLSKRYGPIRVGLWSVWQLVLTLGLVVLALSNKLGSKTATSVLLFGGMAASRLGLWIFDIVENLILQEYTSAAHITSITGWQYSVCNLFDLLQYVLTLVVSDPSLFVIPASISLGFIVVAALVYTYVVWKNRGHLFHKLKLR